MSKNFRRILVANRGEIAIRVFQACTELEKQTIAIYSEADSLALHRYKADEAYLIGENLTPVGAYLDMDGLVDLAKRKRVDAIHPGYGFLSENAEFARKCLKAGIAFIGPNPGHLEIFGDKVQARNMAIAAGLPVPPGTPNPVSTDEEAVAFAEAHGYPLMVKAVSGGGGRGMRVVRDPSELLEATAAARREAAAAFGEGAVYLEKLIENPRHIEVQILGDGAGNVIHLWERDCSVQRRHQKVVEIAPAVTIPRALRDELCAAAVRLMTAAKYVNAGTVEFLVDPQGLFYFIEVNPRIQVEHTVTELVMGVDLVQAQIRIAEGATLEEMGLTNLGEPRGCAIQCRVTTEDPENGFLPDTGRILAYRPASGFGIRLDTGNGYAGAEVTPHYDSLLVKICAWSGSFTTAAAKMHRSLQEFRVRGIKTNIPFLENVVQHPDFLAGEATTTFIDSHPELFRFPARRDRGTKLLRYIGHVMINGAEGVKPGSRQESYSIPIVPAVPTDWQPPTNTPKALLDHEGPDAVVRWIKAQSRLLLTDTTMRDAHQSLLATRMRSADILQVAQSTGAIAPEIFSLECWGGATFDTAYRFLKEDPWERLAEIRERVPHMLLQMLLRGQSVVAYQTFPDNVVESFVKEAARTGIDLFRIFDSLNYLPNMRVAIEAVRDAGKLAEVSICYTGDILDPNRTRYDLAYFVQLAKEIERAGAHILAIKDMAGLLKPQAAYILVKALREEIGIPIHLHTHDSAGNGVATILKAAEAGVHLADGALGSMSAGTSQPSLNALVAALEGTERATGLHLDRLQSLADYWAGVRRYYHSFEGGSTAPDASVYRSQMPGGQYSNLRQQAEGVGLGQRWSEVVQAYRQGDELLGEWIKVTPSSKAMGDLALFMVQNGLNGDNFRERATELDFPQSVVDMMAGRLGQPPYGFPLDLQQVILKGREAISERPGALLPPVDLGAQAERLQELLGREPTSRETISYVLFPEVFTAFQHHREQFSDTATLDTPTFFYGLRLGETVAVEIEPGKRLMIKLTAVGETQPDGTCIVYFELNGTPREVRVTNMSATPTTAVRAKADHTDWRQVAATMPGKVIKVLTAQGDDVKKGEQLLVVEAMKMETTITAPRDGRVITLLVQAGDRVLAGDLLVQLTGD
jgi:pyruvate carboxylase